MWFRLPLQVSAGALLACASLAQSPAPPSAPAEAQPPLSSTAERVYEMARPRILQIRTLLQSAGRQSSIGSGFLVSADGLAITNYHVVSQFALDPRTYRLEYLAPDGAKGALKLLQIDVANDLAVVKLDRAGLPTFEFDPRALAGKLPRASASTRWAIPSTWVSPSSRGPTTGSSTRATTSASISPARSTRG
jgi:S1-C subfamily serine protease